MKAQFVLALSLILTTGIGVNVKSANAAQDEAAQLTQGKDQITQTVAPEGRRRSGPSR